MGLEGQCKLLWEVEMAQEVGPAEALLSAGAAWSGSHSEDR